jgi:hypothetical protein
MKKLLSLIAIAALTLSSGCSLFSKEPISDAGSLPTSQAEIKETTTVSAPPIAGQGIEVAWKIPSDPVDGYIIRYGATPDSLPNEVRVSIIEIREEQDPELGPVFRYLIKGIPDTRRIYVSIAAFKGDVVSNFSEVLEAD